MSGRVTRKNNRRRNYVQRAGLYWLILGNRAPSECAHPTHEKEYGRLLAEFQRMGPWVGVRSCDQCGCEFICSPELAL